MAKSKKRTNLVEQLRQAINDYGKSLNQLSIASGVGNDQLSRFMRGERGLTLNTAAKICKFLGLRLQRDQETEEE